MLRADCIVSLALLAAVSLGFTSDDKETPQPSKGVIETTTTIAPPVGIISPQENDSRIARWLVVDNDAMIGCAELAENHGSNGEVKEFAHRIAVDHKRFREVFKTFTGTQLAARNGTQQAATGNTAALLKDDGLSRNGRLVYRPTDFLEVKERVCNELHSKAEKEFRNLKGADFDRAFVTHMLFGHEAMVATLSTVKRDATATLQASLNEMEQMSQKHLQELRRLHKAHGAGAVNSEGVTEAK